MSTDLKDFAAEVIAKLDRQNTIRGRETRLPREIAEGHNCSLCLIPKASAIRVALVAKLRRATTLSASGHVSRIVVLVLVLPKPGTGAMIATASHLSTAHTFATLLSDDTAYLGMLGSHSAKQISETIRMYVSVTVLKQRMWLSKKKGKKKTASGRDVASKKVVGCCCPLIRHKLSSRGSPPSEAKARSSRAIHRQLQRARESSLVWSGHMLGIYNDLARLYSKGYWRGWTEALNRNDWTKLVSGTLWQLFATTAPAISIGLVYSETTKGTIGVTEMLVSEACIGLVYSFLGGQPLAVLRSTGPLLSYVKILYHWTSANFKFDFLPFYLWTGVWLGCFLVLYSLIEASCLIKYCGRFTEEILALMVSFVFIYNAIESLVYEVDLTYDLAFVSLFLGTFLLCNLVNSFRKSRYVTRELRAFISNLAPALSICIVTGLSYCVPNRSDQIQRTKMSQEGRPFATTTGRPWLVDGSGITWQSKLLCCVPGFLVSVLFMTEASIGMLLTVRPEMKLRKGSPYLHWDTFLQGLMVIGCSLFGLPWCMVSLPHSPMNVEVLADTADDDQGNKMILRSRETRWTAFLSHAAMLCLVGFASSWIALIPIGVAFGFLLYMGTESLSDNDLFERFQLFFTDPSLYPPSHYVRFVRRSVIHWYTVIQLLCFIFLWLLHDNFYVPALDGLAVPISMFFPLVLVAMVPFRMFLLPKVFSKLDLSILTSVDEHSIARLFY